MSKCKICASENIIDKKNGSTKLIYCQDCDVYYLRDIPEQNTVDNYYSTDYSLHSGSGDIIEDEHRRLFRSTEQIYLISEIKKFAAAGGSILDIGCDKGFFLDEARRWGFKVKGVEPMTQSSVYAKNIGIDVVTSLDDVSETYDVVTMWHSLEHFTEPKEGLKSIREKIDDSGMIFIRVPAYNSIWSKLLKSRWIWFQPENHYFHYTHKSLGVLLRESGFAVEKISMRYPNDRFTKKMFNNLNSFFRYAFDRSVPFKKRLSRLYEDMTGVELFAVAKKSDIKM